MRVFLNEQSIPEKSTNPEELYTILNKLIQLSASIKKISNNKQIQRHRDLKDKEVIIGKSLIDYIIDLGKSSDPHRRNVKALFLQLFAKAPFLTGFHDVHQTITNTEGKCLKNSCFDDASSCNTGAAVMSAEILGEMNNSQIFVHSSIFGKRKILNINNSEQLNSMIWIYENNGKHDIPKDFIVNGEVHSAMHLTKEEAQNILSNGIMIGKCVFNKVGEQWYKFHCHEKNIYHGFPITIKTPYKDFSSAKILFEEIFSNEDGQLFEEFLNIRNN